MDLVTKLKSSSPPREWCRRPEVLLCANTAKPVHGVVPREILGREWWDETRRAAYASTDFHCVACGVNKYQAKEHQWLEGHEVYTVDYYKGRVEYAETVPLCHWCHCFIHDGRLLALTEKGEVESTKYYGVMAHGYRVLHGAGLRKGPPYSGPMAPWGSWRLVLFGKEYPPLYGSYDEWLAAFKPEVDE